MKTRSLSEGENSPGQNVPQEFQTCQDSQIKQFDWFTRWLKGDQYSHILHHIDIYCKKFGFQKFQNKSHPESIYKNPINGLIYFVKGKDLGSDFGFPRVQTKKKYRWKKMNFTTDLPKKKPYITYVVASAMKSNVSQSDLNIDLPDYRMHAVIPYDQKSHNKKKSIKYILCHVRSGKQKKYDKENEIKVQKCFQEGYTDFYKLFLFLHNSQKYCIERYASK